MLPRLTSVTFVGRLRGKQKKIMIENTNKAIAYNTIILYIRLFITLICGLFTTRFALKALGDVDFGLMTLVGSVIIFASLINTTMVSSSNRFIAAAIGRGNVSEIRSTFNVNVIIHYAISVLTLFIAVPIGYWFILHYINYNGPISNAVWVYIISITGTIISFIGVPYNGLMLARERFLPFCLIDSIFHIIKLIVSWLLIYYFSHKLIIYAIVIGFNTAMPTFLYHIYCKLHFPEITKFELVKNKRMYKETLSFSGYVAYGAAVQVGQTQIAAVLINIFFNTIMNTALGIANYLKSSILLFTDNLTKSISPQITKSYAAGNYSRCINLMVIISRISFLVAFLISTPFLLETKGIINFWLGSVPPYTVPFSRIIIVTILLSTLSKGIAEYVFASGNIKYYQLIVNSILLFSIVVGYICLKVGFPAYSLLLVFLAFEIIMFFVRLMVLKIYYKFEISKLIHGSYLPCFIVALLCLPLYLYILSTNLNLIVSISVSIVYILIISYFVAFTKNERLAIFKLLKKN